MGIKHLAIGLALLFPTSMVAQPAGDSISRLVDSTGSMLFQDYDKTMMLIGEVEASVRAAGINENIHYLLEALDFGVTNNRYVFHPQVCRQLLEKATGLLSQYREALGDKYPEYERTFKTQWAGFYFDIDDYQNAYRLYTENLDDYLALPRTPDNCMSLFQIAQYLAMIHERQGEMDAAINQYQASIDYYTCAAEQIDVPVYALVFRNVGKAYLNKGDFKNAQLYFNRAEDSLRVALKKSVTKREQADAAITLYEIQTQYYIQQNKFDSALLVVRKAEPYLKYSEPFRGRYHLILGTAEKGAGKLTQAHENYIRAIELIRSRGEKSVLLANAYLVLGKLMAEQNQEEAALNYFTKAIESLVLDYRPDENGNPLPTDILSNKHLFNVLVEKYRLFEKQYNAKKDVQFLRNAWATHSYSIKLLDSAGNTFSNDKDKVVLAEQSFPMYEDGIRLAYTLFLQTGDERYFNECFVLTDKSKGLLLLEKVRSANSFAGVSQHWLDQERDLRSELLNLEQELFMLVNKSGTEEELLTLRENFAKRKRDYSTLIATLKAASPAYYDLRFDHSVLDPALVQQKLLDKDETLVEFFMGDSALTIFAFSKEKKYVTQKKIPAGFSDDVLRFRNQLTQADDMLPSEELLQQANTLYTFLLKDALDATGIATSLTIIPDGVLSFLPFEVLTKEPGRDPDYLLNYYTIRYGFSASYLSEQMARNTQPAKNFFAGFVSTGEGFSSSNRSTLAPLPFAKREVMLIAEVLGSGYEVFEKATKNDFISHAGDYRIVHLAMHSLVNHENPIFSSMMFSSPNDSLNDKADLFAIELYAMQLKSDLAVLSACETGMGTLHKGEGIMSFSRAFAYAGVPAAIISLWKVPDKATSMIMVKFYAFLKEGHRKDVALQLAKTEFVKEYPQMSHPFYWSGFVLTGNNNAIPFPSTSWMWWAITITIGGVVLVIVVWQLKLRKGF